MISSKHLFSCSRTHIFNSLRAFGSTSQVLNKATDPVQKLFLDKIQEYKSKSSGGKIVDSSPEIEREMKTELERVAKQFGGGSGVDMTKFPGFKFEDPQIDPISN